MKRFLYLLTFVVIFSLFGIVASAEEVTNEYLVEFEKILPDWLSGITEDEGRLRETVGIQAILNELISAIKGEGSQITSFFLMLVGCVTLINLAGTAGGQIGDTASSGVGVICSVLIFGVLSTAFEEISSSLDQLNLFFSSLIPITASVTAVGGGVQTATVSAGGMYLTLQLVGGIGQQLLLALASLGLGVSLLSSVGGSVLTSVVRGIRSTFFWVLGIFSAIISAGISLQTLVASAQDSLSIRAAKYMTTGLVPIVGSTVSGALSTLASGLSYVKDVIGAGSVIAIVGMIISPLALLLLYRLSLSLAGILSDFTGSFAGRIFDSFRFSLDMIISVFALSAVIYIFEIILFIKIGVAIL